MSSSSIVITFILIALVFAVTSLGCSLIFIIKGQRSNLTAKALTIRICLSLATFILLYIAFSQGWLTPHPISGW